MLSGKRKKRHDKDKYYNLAKAQGYRSRAAFKLIQINKKYDFLSKARVCIDLCAAPGGWCQVAAKYMPAGSIILGVDLLPIRDIRNVKTLVQDITTQECRTLLKRELQGWRADVVLCDGAPNVGGAYSKDAYLQNEIALLALRCATDHLGTNGTFCTKVYRSQDYNALIWVFNQLFNSVQAIKPSSSRAQSAEIFVLCTSYKNPDKIDPKLLDPKYVFDQQHEEDRQSKMTIFHKSYDKQKRHRGGYDPSRGITLHAKCSVSDFIEGSDPIRLLTDHNQILFDENCQPYLQHKATTEDVRACLDDLKVLNKGDFMRLLRWRLKMRKYQDQLLEAAKTTEQKVAEEEEKKRKAALKEEKEEEEEKDTDEEEEDIQEEIEKIQLAKQQKAKRDKKKQREKAAKLRIRQAHGMEHKAFDVPEHESIFSLATITKKGELEAVREMDLNLVENPLLDRLSDEEDNADEDAQGTDNESIADEDSEDDKNAELEAQMEIEYERYLERKDGISKQHTRMSKRNQRAKDMAASIAAAEDAAAYDGNAKEYIKMLTGGKASSEEDSDSLQDEDSDEEQNEGEESKELNPLVVDFKGEERESVKVARWFSNPLFEGIEEDAIDELDKEGLTDKADNSDGESDVEIEITQGAAPKVAKRTAKKQKKKTQDLLQEKSGDQTQTKTQDAADELLAAIPRSDKQVRKDKRKKALERKERSAKKRAKLDDERIEIVTAVALLVKGQHDKDDEERLAALTPEQRAKELKHRKLIRQGMGAVQEEDGNDDFEIATRTAPSLLARQDERTYGSDEEAYTAHDRAEMLALGAMMLRRSRCKELVDASYNRYAWNDPKDLPEWFVDDESKHHRPQLPIPKVLVDKMKEKFMSLASKPIKKVAEARARKRKRALTALKAAKKQANALANNPEMSEKQKLKAIQQAMKKKGSVDRPGKVYVVAGASTTKHGKQKKGKVKFVDARLRKDSRSAKNMKKRKGKKR